MLDGPLFRYRQLIASGDLDSDSVQEAVAEKLQKLHSALGIYKPLSGPFGWLGQFVSKARRRMQTPPPGLYLFGGVGGGKSMLMELLHETCELDKKERTHFHKLMRDIHDQMHRRRQLSVSEEADPIDDLADEIASKVTLLCLDEMEIRDIGDAMIVGRLFGKLFERGVVVVTTSNFHPDDLYKQGLQREKFLPFIRLIKERLEIVELDAAQDYRLGRILGSTVYHTPNGRAADAALAASWSRLTDDSIPTSGEITSRGRKIHVPASAHQVAQFSFADLCEQALGPSDYLEIAGQFCTVILKGIPQMDEDKKDAARRFVTLIDALYEHKTVLICSADVSPNELYSGKEGGFEFHRTVSRLIEMQAEDYIRARHVE